MSAESWENLPVPTSGDLAPGEHLRAEIDRLGFDQVKLSEATGVSRQSINNIINGRQPISRAMASRLGPLTGRSPDYWLRSSFSRTADAETAPRPHGVAVLVNHQIAQAVRDGTIGIQPFDDGNVQLASLDLTLGNFVITAEGEKIDISHGKSYVLKSGRMVIVVTREQVRFPPDYIGRVGSMSSLARIGVVTSHGFQVDPGFQGNLQFCVSNLGAKDIELRAGIPIISLEIMRLSVDPAPNERATKQLAEASDCEKIIPLFRNDSCDRLVREAIRATVHVTMSRDGAAAKIAGLGVEFEATSADDALDAVVRGALNGLRTLRHHPNAACNDRDKFSTFFDEVADHLRLNGEQAKRAVLRLGSVNESNDTLIVALRDGTEVMLCLPTKSATISLKGLARQMRIHPADPILILTGPQEHSKLSSSD